jgi:phage major head subunit gpT-like protein
MALTISPKDLVKGIEATLDKRMATTDLSLITDLCDVVRMETDEIEHGGMGDAPQVSEFEGSRKHSDIPDYSTIIKNKVYDTSTRGKRDDLRRSQGGMLSVQRLISKFVTTVQGWPMKRLMELIENGTVAVASSGENTPYDGVPFFTTTHPALAEEGGTQSNLKNGTGTTTAQLATDLNSRIVDLRGLKGTNGEPFFGDLNLDLQIVCPWGLSKGFREVLNSTLIDNTSNVQVGMAALKESSRFTDVDDWYLFVKNPGYKPFAWQEDQAFQIDTTGEDSDLWKQKRQFEVGASGAYGAGYLEWRSGIKTTNAG